MPISGEFAKNTVITFVTKILTVALFALAAIFVARALGPEKQGIYSLAILLPATLLTFANFGISQSSVYYICKKKHNPGTILGNNVILSFLIGAAAMVVGTVAILIFGKAFFPGVKSEYLFFALALLPCQLFLSYVNNVLLGLGRIGKFNAALFLQPLVFILFLAILFFINKNFGIGAAIFAEIVSFAFAGIVALRWAARQAGGIIFKISNSYLKDAFCFGGKIYAANVFSFINQRAGVFISNIFIGPAAAGFYAIASGMAEKLWLFAQSAETIFFPKAASENNERTLKNFTPLICRNLIFIAALIATGFFIIGDWLIAALFSKAYIAAAAPFKILLVGTIAVSGSKILANDIAGRGKPAVNAYLAAGAAILNIFLNVLLIPPLGTSGAAWAAALSYAALFVGQTAAYVFISKNRAWDALFIKKSDFDYYLSVAKLLRQKLKS